MNVSESTSRNDSKRSVIPEGITNSAPKRVSVGLHRRVDDVKVELVTDQGVVQKIQITCSCGRQIELQCQY